MESAKTEEPVGQSHADTGSEQPESIWSWLISDLTGNPINAVLILAIVYILYKIMKPDSSSNGPPTDPPLPAMKKQDFTLEQLRQYDGNGPDGRVLIGVLGKVYDVTKGKRFYGPGGPYSGFAGRDASRGLATFEITNVRDVHDDLSDLKPSELEQVREWDEQFSERYQLVGKLLKPGEEPSSYSDDEDESEESKKDQ